MKVHGPSAVGAVCLFLWAPKMKKKTHTDGFSRMCAVIMCARKVPDCSLENHVPWSSFFDLHPRTFEKGKSERVCMYG